MLTYERRVKLEQVTCSKCGAAYRLIKHHLGIRDKDDIQCKYCGTTIKSWNGSNIFTEEEIHGPTKPYKPKE
jgi:predicted Zn finger-like uncharacterized protein